MTTTKHRNVRRRSGEQGAVLMVVLLAMIALLGLGMTGLFLTSGSIQMNTNINLRNQALVVAEAGIERARGVLNNPNWTPPVPDMLAAFGAPNTFDELPTSTTTATATDHCLGKLRGAILVDRITPGCTSGAGCPLRNVDSPSPIEGVTAWRTGDLPSTELSVSRPTMGNYTVYIRQDPADCRMGNFTCEYASVATVTGTTTTTGTETATVTQTAAPCDPPVGAPAPNGALVVRSEGVAVDGKTRVVLEVTMTPSQGAAQAANTPLSALCASGAAGCDDNASVQAGIVVNGSNPLSPPPTITNTNTNPYSNTNTNTNTDTNTSTDTGTTTLTNTDSSTSTDTSTSTSTATTTATTTTTTTNTTTTTTTNTNTSTCANLSCPVLAVLGVYAKDKRQPTVNFSKWLADHSSECVAQDLGADTNVITYDPSRPNDPVNNRLGPYNVIIVLDVGHNLADYDALNLTTFPSAAFDAAWKVFSQTPLVRQFSSAEGDAVKRWVQNGGGLLVTNGYDDSLYTKPNFNKLIQPLGLTYFSPSCGLPTLPTSCGGWWPGWNHSEYGAGGGNYGGYDITSFLPPAAITAGMTKLYMSGYWPISGWPTGSRGFQTEPGANYSVWAYHTPGAAVFPTAPHNTPTPYKIGVAGTVGSGRVVVVADEWLTYDYTMGSTTYKATALAFWNNALKWLGKCP